MQRRPPRNRLEQVRLQRSVTLAEIATACGVYASTVSHWQKGAIPPEHLPTVGRLLDVSVPYLTGWSDEDQPYSAPSTTRVAS